MTSADRPPEDRELAPFTAALRDEMSGADPARAAATRRALLAAAASRGRRRSRRIRHLLPMAAAFAISAAWAASTGRLPTASHDRSSAPIQSPVPEAPRELATANVAPTAQVVAVSDLPSATPVEDTIPTTTPTKPAPAPSARPSSTSPSPAANERSPSDTLAISKNEAASEKEASSENDAEENAYRAAHEAHFVAHDSARALAAWEAYLTSYPQGRFAPEATYNRAICLLRLGRVREARPLLQSFAEGRFGDYRRKEARALLDKISP